MRLARARSCGFGRACRAGAACAGRVAFCNCGSGFGCGAISDGAGAGWRGVDSSGLAATGSACQEPLAPVAMGAASRSRCPRRPGPPRASRKPATPAVWAPPPSPAPSAASAPRRAGAADRISCRASRIYDMPIVPLAGAAISAPIDPPRRRGASQSGVRRRRLESIPERVETVSPGAPEHHRTPDPCWFPPPGPAPARVA